MKAEIDLYAVES